MSSGTGALSRESLAALDAAISEWHRVRDEIAPEDEKRLWKKFRLEWNYNSNRIEGNTLTYDETVLLKQPNHVRTVTGELHKFAEPEETPARMAEWVRRFRSDLAREDYPLPEFLAESHWSFVHIHPFDDGNGRTARLLTNYLLLWKDLPPIVIKSRDRDRYIGALRRADAGNGIPLAQFMLTQLLWSLDLGIRAAGGESLREPDDLDKEISLFVREKNPETATRSDIEILDAIYELYVQPMVEKLDRHMEAFADLFRVYQATARIDAHPHKIRGENILDLEQWKGFREELESESEFALGDPPVMLRRAYSLEDYRGDANEGFSLMLHLQWVLGRDARQFEVKLNGPPIEDASHGIPYASLGVESAGVQERVEVICQAVMDKINTLSRGTTPG
ncbi:Fic family protein [Candidatus Palauibacter sp.]|uniref:Fic family protein n=1 Tax=Candidatus Palauibacter sp. TaxID=3101350 RepID=UPI003AF2D332